MAAANAEAQRLIDLAAATGSPFAAEPGLSFAKFVADVYRPLFMPRLKPGTQKRYDALLERQGVVRFFGRHALDAIDASLVRRYAAELEARGVKPKGHVDIVASVLRAAVEHGHLASMPSLPRYGVSRKLPEAPSAEDVASLLDAATGWQRPAVALGAFAGLRVGEVRALKVTDIDLEAGVLRVRRSFSEDTLLETTKSNRERVVPLAAELRSILVGAMRDKLPGAFVVVTRSGHPPRRQHVLDRLKRLQIAYGLPQGVETVPLHFFCSRLLTLGANIEAVRMLAGHTELRTTQRYVHATGSELTSAIARLNGPATGNRVETASAASR